MDVMTGMVALKNAYELLKGMKAVTDASRRAELSIELQQRIMDAQQAQQALIDKLKELQTAVDKFERWDVEAARYQLRDFGGQTFAYELRQSHANGEPTHLICPTCFQQRRKSILQFGGSNIFKQKTYKCDRCDKLLSLGVGHKVEQDDYEDSWLDR
jgi:hypothetical protein